jgi:hypothetical protein
MKCKSCGSQNLNKFPAEVALHLPGLNDLQKPVVWTHPEVWVCLDCGQGEFSVGENDLRELTEDDTTAPD